MDERRNGGLRCDARLYTLQMQERAQKERRFVTIMGELMKVSIFAPFILLGANVHLTRMNGEISNQNIDNEYFISIHLMTYKYDCKKHGGRRLG